MNTEKIGLIERKADLMEELCYGKYHAVMHGCNCWCTMKSGVAKLLTDIYPEIREADNKTLPGNINKLGQYTRVQLKNKTHCFNLYTQYDYRGRQVMGSNIPLIHYDSLETSLKRSVEWLVNNVDNDTVNILMPRIGCGLAGGNYYSVKSIISCVLNDFNFVNFTKPVSITMVYQ